MLKLLSSGALLALIMFADGASALQTNGWMKQFKADASALVKITLPIKQSNLGMVDKLFWEVSNPKSTMYGKFLSFEEVGELVKNEHSTEATVKYLQALGIHADNIKINTHGTFVSALVPVALANAVFDSDFHVYSHPHSKEGRKLILKTESASLPEALKEHVTHVPHVSHFPKISRHVKIIPELAYNSFASGYVTPALLSQYYGIDSTKVSNGATQSLFEALGQMFDNTDLNTFQNQFGLTVQNITKIIGTNVPDDCFSSSGQNDCGEANLDVQYIMGVAQGAETTYWSIDSSSNDPFLDWAEALSSTASPPQVHSISYGGYEESSGDDMTVFNTEIQKLGLQGVSVMVSSGDDGAANSEARSSSQYCGYYASFPASSPYVTAVGATQGPESGSTEITCSSSTGGVITSGGGFSAAFAQPSYQSSQVSAYFSNVGTAPASGFNKKGRGYPDVSVLGYNYALAIGGNFVLESGTSASSPVFAGMITLINDARLAAGKSTLGFLNQALYSLDSSVWNDIVSGDNKCTANPDICCDQGFYAAKGWDPVTGLGSPKFQELKKALVAL